MKRAIKDIAVFFVLAVLLLYGFAWIFEGGNRGLAQQGGGNVGAPGSGNSGYPAGSVPQIATTVNTTNGATNATAVSIPNVAGQFSYICGWNAFTNGGTAQDVSATIGALVTGNNFSYLLSVPAFAATNATKIGDAYTPCLKGSAVNVGISVSIPAQGTGNTNVTVNAWGYTQ